MRSPIAVLLAVPLVLAACAEPARPPAEHEVASAEHDTAPAEPDAAPDPAERASEPPSLTARELDDIGDAHLLAGRFAEAVAAFDAAVALAPEREAHHWRRGIAQYYAGQYEAGAAQFELHRTVNPADVENAAWHFLCVARWKGAAAASDALLPVGRDARVPLPEIYELFAGRLDADHVLAVARDHADRFPTSTAPFYAHLYVGLHHEAHGRDELAERHVRLAATEHATRGYMGDVARVHAATFDE